MCGNGSPKAAPRFSSELPGANPSIGRDRALPSCALPIGKVENRPRQGPGPLGCLDERFYKPLAARLELGYDNRLTTASRAHGCRLGEQSRANSYRELHRPVHRRGHREVHRQRIVSASPGLSPGPSPRASAVGGFSRLPLQMGTGLDARVLPKTYTTHRLHRSRISGLPKA